MEKETLIHLAYALIFIVGITSVLLYQHSSTIETRMMLNQKVDAINDKLDSLGSDLTSESTQRQSQGEMLQNNIDVLSKTLEEQGTVLSGKIARVESESKEQVAKLESSLDKVKLENKDFSDVIDKAVPSVVSISTNVGGGSGFIIDSLNGYVVTNHHVIEDAKAARVKTSDNKEYPVALVGFNRVADIAVLKINAVGLKSIPFGSSDSLKVGEKVIAIGSPGGLDFTVSQGIVSATKRNDGFKREFVQIDVPINPGNSGGPLVTAKGEVVGVNTLKVEGFEGVGFALSSNYVRAVVDEILEN